jgi:hypothetical protein
MRKAIFVIFFLLLPLAAVRPVEVAPLKRQVMILSNVLSYSKKIASETGDLMFGIAGDRENFVSRTLQKTMFESIKEEQKAQVGKRKIVPVMLDVRKLDSTKVDVIYVTPGLKKVDKIVSFARSKKILTITGVAEHLDAGVTIGILPKDDAYQIILNLTGAEQEEVEFDSALHKLAKTMRSPPKQVPAE